MRQGCSDRRTSRSGTGAPATSRSKKGQAYACSSKPLYACFAGDALGLGGKEPDAAALSRMRPERPAKNPEAAPVWDWGGDKDKAISGIASAIGSSVDPRLL